MTDARLPEPLTPDRLAYIAEVADRWDRGRATSDEVAGVMDSVPALLDAARSGATPPPDGLRALIEAAWGGWERPDNDPGILRAIADWMDRLDDVADGLGPTAPVSRTMQADLRRIAAATPPAAPDGLRSWTNDDQCCPGANVTVHAPDCPAAPESDSQKHSDAPDGLPTVEALGLPVYCTGACDACRDFAREKGVPLIVSPPPPLRGQSNG